MGEEGDTWVLKGVSGHRWHRNVHHHENSSLDVRDDGVGFLPFTLHQTHGLAIYDQKQHPQKINALWVRASLHKSCCDVLQDLVVLGIS